MSAIINNLFAFNRTLPEPFNTLSSKKVAVSSRFNPKGESTLSASVIKAINAYCACANKTGKGAVGMIDENRSVAEYKSSQSPTHYHLVVYDKTKGNVIASVYDKDAETLENYELTNTGRDGSAILLAMMPFLVNETEFTEHLNKYQFEYNLGLKDLKKASEIMGVLCDNVYRRITDTTNEAHIKTNLDNSGLITRINQTQIDSEVFRPFAVIEGEFEIFAKTSKSGTFNKAKPIVELKDFIGQYAFSTRSFSPTEQLLIPKLPEWYVVPKEVVEICKHAKNTSDRSMRMRNFLLRGPAGTGKTMSAMAVAAGLNLPYMKYTCSAGTEIYDFIGQVFPNTDERSTGDKNLDEEIGQLKALGGITFDNVSKLLKMPDMNDMDYDSEGAYKTITGRENPAATTKDCMSAVMDAVTEKIRQLCSARKEDAGKQTNSFRYVETDFIKALRNGYVVEIQEPTTIIQPGVLVGLNSLLEQGGSITLPTGEIIRRHPDAVVIITTNVSYEGCRGMNQSVNDRMSLVMDVELPSPEIMVQRAMSVTGVSDELMVSKMVHVVNGIADHCRRNNITDGNVGMRSLIDWIISTEITGDVYKSALQTVISKATSDEDDRLSLISSVLEPEFAPTRKVS